MSRHLFEIIDNYDWSAITGPATIVKNVTSGPFEVDDDGRSLYSLGVAAIDDSCQQCAKGIEDKKLVVLAKIDGPKPAKTKPKTVSEPKQEQEPTVAVAEDNSSVQ